MHTIQITEHYMHDWVSEASFTLPSRFEYVSTVMVANFED